MTAGRVADGEGPWTGRLLARNHGMMASFSPALTEGLTARQIDEDFDALPRHGASRSQAESDDDAGRPRPTSTVAVVGAGISGLCCAHELSRGGVDVVVFERADHVGGRMATRIRDGFHFDIGADHLSEHYVYLRSLCAELGVTWEDMQRFDYAVVRDGHPTPLRQAVGRWSRVKMAIQSMRGPKGTDVFDLDTVAEHDTRNAYEFVFEHTGREAVEYLIDGFCAAYQFHDAHEISVGTLFALMESLRTRLDDWDLRRTTGGMSALPEALAAGLDVRLHSPVSMVQSPGESSGVVLRTPAGAELYDAVVLATTATAARQILASPTEAQRRLLSAVRYSSTISTSFRVELDRLPEGTLFWVPFAESARIASFANEAMKGRDLIQGNRSLLSVWLHEEFARKLMARPDAWIFAAVSEALGDVCPWIPTANLRPHDLQRWPQAEPKFYEGYLRLVRSFQEDHQGAGGIYLSGDYLNAPWTEGAARKGRDVAHRILAHRDDAGARRRP